jgi:hypothetical protein
MVRNIPVYQATNGLIIHLKKQDMGNYRRGILGNFSGKVGTVIGSHWKGIDYMRSLPRKSGKAPTEQQYGQQLKFALAVSFSKPISALVNEGFASLAKEKVSGYNLGVQQVMKEAITGVFPNYEIDYSKVRISEGSLAPSVNALATAAAAGSLTISWTDNTAEEDNAFTDDRLMVLVYNPTKARYLFTTRGAERGTGSHTVNLPANFSGDEVEVYISFISRDGNKAANSDYLGKVTVAA